jgi:hypothetical protein
MPWSQQEQLQEALIANSFLKNTDDASQKAESASMPMVRPEGLEPPTL